MKLIFRSILLQMLALMISMAAFAQSGNTIIRGKITSFDESLPLEGVSITVKDGKNITGSQADGTFSLEIAAADKILVISLTGYERKEIKLTGASEYDIVLRRAGSIAVSYDIHDHPGLRQSRGLSDF